jgi:hypothetical protein
LFNRLILKENQHRKKCPAFAPLYPTHNLMILLSSFENRMLSELKKEKEIQIN